LLVDVPSYVQELASTAGMSSREYVLSAIGHFSHKATSLKETLTAFLESDDSVARRVRERLGGRSLPEIAAELESCLSIAEEDDRIFAVKNALAGTVRSGGVTRDASDENDEIELLDLAESLLEKLAQIKLN
jgi:hypothetical protein